MMGMMPQQVPAAADSDFCVQVNVQVNLSEAFMSSPYLIKGNQFTASSVQAFNLSLGIGASNSKAMMGMMRPPMMGMMPQMMGISAQPGLTGLTGLLGLLFIHIL